MDSGVYVHNTVTAIPNGAQQEQKRMVFMPGIVSTARSGIEKAVTFTNSATYTVDDEDECIHCVTTSNDVTIELPVATKGRTITGLKKAGANNVIFDAGAGKLVYRSGTGSQTRTITTIGEAWTVQAEDDGGNWYVIGSSN
jgi:predicted GNAT family acetyltransferase